MPTQWLGLVIVFYLASPLGLPQSGHRTASDYAHPRQSRHAGVPQGRTEHMILPALTLGLVLYGESHADRALDDARDAG